MTINERAPQGAARRGAQHALWSRGILQGLAGLAVFAAVQPLGAGLVATAAVPPVQRSHGVSTHARMVPPPAPAALSHVEPGLIRSILDTAFPQAPGIREVEPGALNPDEPIAFGTRTAPRWLVETLLKAAHVAGVDPVYLMALADVESSLSPDAKAPTSSAEGLFQFIDQTWLETVHTHAASHGFAAAAQAISIVDGEPTITDDKARAWVLGLRRDPYFSALMASELIKDVQRALHAVGERELAEAELYLAHFFGATTAVRFLQALDEEPNAVAARIFPKAAKANKALFTEMKGRKRRPITVAQFYERIDSKIERRIDRYAKVAPLTVPPARVVERVQRAEVVTR